MIPFGPWTPDAYDLNAPLAGEALGVLPGVNSYHPWPALQAFSAALSTAANGAFLARSTAGTYAVFVGQTTKLLKFASVSSWSDFSGTAYAVPAGGHWSMAQFGDTLIAVNGNAANNPQFVAVTGGTVFGDLTGSPPKAAMVRTVGNFVMLGNTANYPQGVEWSGLNDPTFWTHGTRSSDYQDFKDGGFVTGITPLEVGLVFQQNAIRRFVAVQDRAVFNFARVEDGQGNIAPDSIAISNATAYFVSRAGFRKIGPDTGYIAAPIGLEVVDKWFQDNVNLGRLSEIWGCVDPFRPRIFWLVPAGGSTSAVMSILLCYDIRLNRWTHTTTAASLIFSGATPGYTLTGLAAIYATLADVPAPFGSSVWQGGNPNLAAFDSLFKLAFFNGDNQAATVQTNEFQPIPGKRAFVSGFRPIGDAMNVTGRIATRERPQDNPVWAGAATTDARGMIPARASSRLHRIELSIAAGQTWTHLQGVDFGQGDLREDGLR